MRAEAHPSSGEGTHSPAKDRCGQKHPSRSEFAVLLFTNHGHFSGTSETRGPQVSALCSRCLTVLTMTAKAQGQVISVQSPGLEVRKDAGNRSELLSVPGGDTKTQGFAAYL